MLFGSRLNKLASIKRATRDEFVMVITTTAANETFTIPTQNAGTFDADIEWGDGSTSSISAYNDSALTHTYAAPGDHRILIRGSFPNIYFNNGGDKLKVKRVENLGDVGWTDFAYAFFGCSNMTSFVAGDCDTSSVSNMERMFQSCKLLTTLDVSSFDTSSVTNMVTMFRNLFALTTLDVSSFDTSSVTNMANMFYNSSSLTDIVGVEDFNIEAINNTNLLNNFLFNVTLPTARYDALLINWDAQEPFDGMRPNFGDSQYTAGGAAAAARANLISNDGWTITDGGTA